MDSTSGILRDAVQRLDPFTRQINNNNSLYGKPLYIDTKD